MAVARRILKLAGIIVGVVAIMIVGVLGYASIFIFSCVSHDSQTSTLASAPNLVYIVVNDISRRIDEAQRIRQTY